MQACTREGHEALRLFNTRLKYRGMDRIEDEHNTVKGGRRTGD
jgi:hypothetical protein